MVMHIETLTSVCLVGIYACLILPGEVHADPNDGNSIPNPSQLRSRMLEGWQQLQQWDETEKEYQVNAQIKSMSDKTPEELLYQIRIKPSSWLCEGQLRTNSPGIAIYCQSPFYTFVIVKKTAEGKKDWTLGSFDKIDPQNGFQRDLFGPNKSVLFYPLSAFGPSLLHIMRKEVSFSIKRVHASGNGKLRVDFAYPVKAKDGREGNVAGWMIVDPHRFFVVLDARRTSTFQPGYEMVDQREVEDVPEAPGGLRCKSHEFRVVNLSTNQAGERLHRDYHNYSYHSIPDEVFRLSHYGLPEPLDAPPVASPHKWLWLWIILTAVGLAGVAVGIRAWRAERENPEVES